MVRVSKCGLCCAAEEHECPAPLVHRVGTDDAVPVKFKVVVTRVETTEQWVRAPDEEAAIRKVEEELTRSYAYIESWEIRANEIRVVEAQQSVSVTPRDPLDPTRRLITLKEAAKVMSVSYSKLYRMAADGEIEHTKVGSPYYMSQESLDAFIRDNNRS